MFHQDYALQQLLKWCIHKGHRSIKQAKHLSLSGTASLWWASLNFYELRTRAQPHGPVCSLTPNHQNQNLSDYLQSPELIPQWRVHLQGLGPGIFSRGCPACAAVWPKAQRRDRISKALNTITVGFERGSLQALLAVLAFHLQFSVQTTSPVTSHIPWPPSGASTGKGCKGQVRLFWVLNSAKEENCPKGIEGRESYKVNGSFYTRMQETTGLCTSSLNGVVALSRALWRKGCISVWKGSFSCWQMTARSVLPRSTSHIFGLLLSRSVTGFSYCVSPSRAFFCHW